MNDIASFLRDQGIHGEERRLLQAVFTQHERQWFLGHVLMIVLALAGLMGSAFLATPGLDMASGWAVPAVLGFIAAFFFKAYLLWSRDTLPAPVQQFCQERDAALVRIGGHYPPY